MLAFGTSVVFDDVAVTTRLFAGVCGVTDREVICPCCHPR